MILAICAFSSASYAASLLGSILTVLLKLFSTLISVINRMSIYNNTTNFSVLLFEKDYFLVYLHNTALSI